MSFHWLANSMAKLTAATISSESPASAKRLFVRFMARYALLGVATYAMIRGSTGSATAIMVGLLLIVPALMIEAAYLAAVHWRHSE
jgi:hypothetical protein